MRRPMNSAFVAILCLVVITGSARDARCAATIVIQNDDGAGEGFNDPAPFTPVGGNPATTLGAARLNAFQYAANLWATCLNSSVTILVGAQMNPLDCTTTLAILGFAGTSSAHRDFTGAPVVATWYPQALANSLAGADLDPTTADITAQFNSSIGSSAGCLSGYSWYFGYDSNPGANQFDFVSVVAHEIGHGLGFQSFSNKSTGTKFQGFNDVFMLLLNQVGAAQPNYSLMSDAQRVAANTSDPNLRWFGVNVATGAEAIPITAGLNGGYARIYAPNPLSQSSVSHFSTALVPNELMEPFYTGPNHNILLTTRLMKDLGWSVVNKCPPAWPAASLLNPANGAQNLSTTGLLDWSDVLGADRYTVSIKCAGGDAVTTASTSTSQYNYSLQPGQYTWSITAYNNCGGTTGASSIWLFTVGAGAVCTIPVLLEPADSSQCVGLVSDDPRRALAILRWEPIPGASGYLLVIKRGDTCDDNPEIPVTGTEYLAEVDWEETYSWAVREDCPCAEYSACRLFTTALRPDRMHVPNLESPGLHADDQPLSGFLEWSPVGGAVGYRVQLSTACGDADSVDVLGPTWGYSGLQQNTQYFWRVRSLDACGNGGDYSACWDFRTIQFTGLDRVYFPGGLTAALGSTGFELPILIENLSPLQRIEKIDVRFKGEVFEVVGWTLAGTRSAAVPGVTVDFNGVGSDQARIKITYSSDSSCPQSLGTGVGPVLKLLLNIKPDAPLGMAALTLNDSDFRKCGGTVFQASMFDGQVNIMTPTGIGNVPPITRLNVLAPYPNPFGTSATIDVGLPNASNVELQVFDVSGRRVSSRSMGEMGQGWQRIAVHATDDSGKRLPSGVYFYRVTAAGEAITRKMVITR